MENCVHRRCEFLWETAIPGGFRRGATTARSLLDGHESVSGQGLCTGDPFKKNALPGRAGGPDARH